MPPDREQQDHTCDSIDQDIQAIAAKLPRMKHPPVHLWNPELTGALDMRIARDGVWHYQGSEIRRPAMTRLFAGILKYEKNHYYLVTPVEKYRIQVEDAPFVVVEMTAHGSGREQVLTFRTNVEDHVMADADHGLRFVHGLDGSGARPYIMVRNGLEALIQRAVYYDLMELVVNEEVAGRDYVGLWSAGVYFPIMEAALLDEDVD